MKINIIANYLGQFISGILAIAFIPVYIDYLGVEAYGLIGIYVVLHNMILLFDLGMSATLNRELARHHPGKNNTRHLANLLRTIEVITLLLALLICLLLFNMSTLIADYWLNPVNISVDEMTAALMLMSIVISVRFYEGIYRGALYGLERQVLYNIINVFFNLLRYAGAILVLVYISNSIEVFFAWQAVVASGSLIMLYISVHRSIPESAYASEFSLKSLRQVWKYSLGVMGISALTSILLQADKILLSNMISLKEFGYYSLAATASSVLFMVVVPVTQAAFPRFVRLLESAKSVNLINLYHTVTQLISVLLAPAAFTLGLLSSNIIFVWSGNRPLADNTAHIISLLSIGCFLNAMAYIPHQMQLASKWTGLLVKTYLVVVVFLVVMIYVLVPSYGVTGAAWSWLIANAAYFLFLSHFMHNRLLCSEKWAWYIIDILIPVSASVLPICIAMSLYHVDEQGRAVQLFYLVAVWLLSTIFAVLFSPIIRQKAFNVFISSSLLGSAR